MVCSKDTRLQQQSRRHSPIKWPFGSFCGRTRRRKSARIRPKGTDKYQVGKLFHDPGRMHNVDSKVSQLSIRGDKHALARFSESENFEHSFYVALHVEKHVLIAKQIAQWRRDFTTLRGRGHARETKKVGVCTDMPRTKVRMSQHYQRIVPA